MPRKLKKQKKRLEARIMSWESGKGDKIDNKNKESELSGFYMRKPGSFKK